MNKHRNKYWHIQMYKPYGKENEARVDSKKMLEREESVIGTGEWNHHQCKNFKAIEKGSIVLVREGNEAIALCQIISFFIKISGGLKYWRGQRIINNLLILNSSRKELFSHAATIQNNNMNTSIIG